LDLLNWLSQLQTLPPDRLFVEHHPPTPRYGRAQSKLRWLVRESVLLGERPASRKSDNSVEIAVWARPATGKHGYYSCFRLFLEGEEVLSALLFCFYDGTEESPGFRSVDGALAYALSQGFEVKRT
jgi:hypothetical protein